jgi:patatin-like phospholipase/acyl hydrolase
MICFQKIFFRQRLFTNPLNLFRAKYTNKGLHKALEKYIGTQKTMGDVFQQFGEKPVFLIPSLDLNPYLTASEIPSFKIVIFNSAYHRDRNEKLLDVAMRTSAAAVNLPIYQQYGEGGNYANDPCVFGLSFAMNNHPDTKGDSALSNHKLGLGKNADEIRLLSLGCGSTGSSYVPEKHLKNPDWGLLKWQRYLISLVIDTNMVGN